MHHIPSWKRTSGSATHHHIVDFSPHPLAVNLSVTAGPRGLRLRWPNDSFAKSKNNRYAACSAVDCACGIFAVFDQRYAQVVSVIGYVEG